VKAAEQLAELPIWRGRAEISRLHAGRTNENFLIRDLDRRYFGRVGNDVPEHGILRSAERSCHALAADAGIAPQIAFAGDGLLVVEYVEGTTLDIAVGRTQSHMVAIAAMLRRLHAMPAPERMPAFCPVAACYRSLTVLGDGELPVSRPRLLAELARLPRCTPQCLVHGDLIPENFIEGADRLMLVDWEYAGGGVPEIDLAILFANFAWSPAEVAYFLDRYGAVDHELIAQYRIAAIVREALWCRVQARLSPHAPDLPEYTRVCERRLGEIMP
jgi:aminoglycoside phosphotransferase (APT) family kinase protein